mgnify:CR=1 FL=1|tara:strand:- start:1197 stop:1607 length:411 start_codon:yes stop_codon:yes gene_type:complete
MTTFGELINKANDQDKKDIRDVMSAFLKKTEKDIITPDIILESKNELDRLRGSPPMSQGDFVSIENWKRRHKVFLDYVNNKKGGRRKRRKKTRRRRRKRTRKGGFLLLGYAAYKAYNGLTKKTKKRRRKKRRKNKK